MADYLLDTNHLSPLVTAGHPSEMLFGIGLLPRAQHNRQDWAQLRSSFNYYDVTRDDAELAAELHIALRRRGRQLDTVDALTAAIALREDLILLTTNGDFGAVPNLQQENWLANQ